MKWTMSDTINAKELFISNSTRNSSLPGLPTWIDDPTKYIWIKQEWLLSYFNFQFYAFAFFPKSVNFASEVLWATLESIWRKILKTFVLNALQIVIFAT